MTLSREPASNRILSGKFRFRLKKIVQYYVLMEKGSLLSVNNTSEFVSLPKSHIVIVVVDLDAKANNNLLVNRCL